MGYHEELLGITESVFKNLASVSQTATTVQGEGWKVPLQMVHVLLRANQNLGYFEIFIWIYFLSVCFPEDSNDFPSEKAEQLRNYYRNLY